MEAGLNPTSDPTSEFVTQGEKRGTGYEWTCKCCQGTFTGHKRKLTIHIAAKKFLNDKEMGVRACTLVAMIKQSDQFVPNTERVWSAYGRVHTDTRNRMSKNRAKKLVKVYFNGRALQKARKVEWASKAFMQDGQIL